MASTGRLHRPARRRVLRRPRPIQRRSPSHLRDLPRPPSLPDRSAGRPIARLRHPRWSDSASPQADATSTTRIERGVVTPATATETPPPRASALATRVRALPLFGRCADSAPLPHAHRVCPDPRIRTCFFLSSWTISRRCPRAVQPMPRHRPLPHRRTARGQPSGSGAVGTSQRTRRRIRQTRFDSPQPQDSSRDGMSTRTRRRSMSTRTRLEGRGLTNREARRLCRRFVLADTLWEP